MALPWRSTVVVKAWPDHHSRPIFCLRCLSRVQLSFRAVQDCGCLNRHRDPCCPKPIITRRSLLLSPLLFLIRLFLTRRHRCLRLRLRTRTRPRHSVRVWMRVWRVHLVRRVGSSCSSLPRKYHLIRTEPSRINSGIAVGIAGACARLSVRESQTYPRAKTRTGVIRDARVWTGLGVVLVVCRLGDYSAVGRVVMRIQHPRRR